MARVEPASSRSPRSGANRVELCSQQDTNDNAEDRDSNLEWQSISEHAIPHVQTMCSHPIEQESVLRGNSRCKNGDAVLISDQLARIRSVEGGRFCLQQERAGVERAPG